MIRRCGIAYSLLCLVALTARAQNATWTEFPGSPEISPEVAKLLAVGADDSYSMAFTLDALILGRTAPDAQVVASDGTGNTVLDAADIDVGAKIGPRASLMLGGRKTGMEFTFFGFNDHSFSGVANDTGVTPMFFGGIPANPVPSYDINLRARLMSAELMFWKPWATNLRVGAGIRGVGLAEEFDILNTGQGQTGFFAQSDNDLVGFQIGSGWGLCRNQFLDLDVTAKTGVYHHGVRMSAIAQNFDIFVDDDEVTMVSELDVGASIHLGRHSSIRAGYFLLWLDDVAVSVNQSSSWNVISEQGAFNLGSVIYQGGYFGFEARF